DINSSMPAYVVGKIADALNEERLAIRGSRILLLGVAYKRNSNDLRESPALDICTQLQKKGAEVLFHDPYITEMKIETGALRRSDLSIPLLESAACVVVVTDHSSYDWQFIVDHAALVVDTRNATAGTRPKSCRIVKL
ncbi:MAG TPA: UDP binding domain-containing protein, partial [Acidobacteriota bacterium]|nr:UDP binding domain-containing protein [Acidobacteriota bacterium]